MPNDTIRLIKLYAAHAIPYLLNLVWHKILAVQHRYSYRPVDDPKNVIVIGGSFAGLHLAQRLAQTLPTGYRVVLIERNSHFNYLFAFPRYSVVPGYEEMAFLPYDNMARSTPPGIYERVRGTVQSIEQGAVHLQDGSSLPFSFVVIATGSQQPVPAKLLSDEKDAECEEMQQLQGKVLHAQKIAVVGGGAVGVQIAADIKNFHPHKDVTLVHSREHLLPSFGPRLHAHARQELEVLGVRLRLGERPTISISDRADAEKTLKWSDGTSEIFDLVIPCTGQRPNSSVITTLAPEAISKATNRIHVNDKLQVSDPDGQTRFPNIYATGDVAETGAPKMARAGMIQAEIVVQNILTMIQGRDATTVYKSNRALEGTIKLTLGIHNFAVYSQAANGEELLLPSKRGAEDLDIKRAWSWYGVDMKQFPAKKGGMSTAQ